LLLSIVTFNLINSVTQLSSNKSYEIYNILFIHQELLNKRTLSVNYMIIATLAVTFGTAMTTTNSVWAATINCPNAVGFFNCNGTNDPDTMLGTANEDGIQGFEGDDRMFGFASDDALVGDAGDDTMSGGSGDDRMTGGGGNDNINGDSGHDEMSGGIGADILKGSSGNDKISHFLGPVTRPDRSIDTIDCGSGNDEAWINVSDDHDTAVNCETVHSDINP
jgi:Ca2+-binding RTX toxin-like protein